ncbi:unnamed protein product [Cuscuta epithymum]|uniref:Uncharacterized protein n=1 Tax=Cuscuta epithymum TaxID=186058 RepID=A0AAV0DET2_9ASTE|nr:unnamed protein product [Cuscuta epithymum]
MRNVRKMKELAGEESHERRRRPDRCRRFPEITLLPFAGEGYHHWTLTIATPPVLTGGGNKNVPEIGPKIRVLPIVFEEGQRRKRMQWSIWSEENANMITNLQLIFSQDKIMFILFTDPAVTGVLVSMSTLDKVNNKYYLGPTPMEVMAKQIPTTFGPCGNNSEYIFKMDIGHEDKYIVELANEVRKALGMVGVPGLPKVKKIISIGIGSNIHPPLQLNKSLHLFPFKFVPHQKLLFP